MAETPFVKKPFGTTDLFPLSQPKQNSPKPSLLPILYWKLW